MGRGPLVVMLLEYFALGGGAEGQVRMLAESLPEFGYDVEVWHYKRAPQDLPALRTGTAPIRLISGHGGGFAFVARLGRELRRRRVTLLHTWMTSANLYGRLAGVLLAGVPVVSSERTSGKERSSVVLDRLLTPLSEAVVANSAGVCTFFLEQVRARPRRMLVVPNGVDVDVYRRVPEGDQLRQALGCRPGTLVVGTVGRHIPDKQQEWLIEATAKLRRGGLDAIAVLAGFGESEPALRQRAESLGVRNSVHFLGVRRDVSTVLSALDVFVLPSRREGMPNALLEAMAVGLPVLATDVPGVEDLLGQPGRDPAGVMVSRGDLDGFIGELDLLARDGERRQELGARAAARVRDLFSRKVMVKAYADLYGEVLRCQGGSHAG